MVRIFISILFGAAVIATLGCCLRSPSIHVADGFEFVRIQPGTFQMGSDIGDDDETPVHTVRISSAFYIGATEVTQAQWIAVMGRNPSYFDGDNLPVEQVSWIDCMDFCKRLTEREKTKLPSGWVYRLPTEAEWEYCCRAGSTTDSCLEYDSIGMKIQVKKGNKPNDWGLYDMNGNVWEWCLDAYDEKFYMRSPEIDPCNLTSGRGKVLRGGSWISVPRSCRSAYRNGSDPSNMNFSIGFRLVISRVTHQQ